ncbi:hypothetical protein AMAG_01000 [Allomyces macrogynus ATCC 38327]|uniref:DUF3429 domain-containing protein n=1 Tax=Allomyces macrogynus (strain ATCC 38327) TaxID=578462 RepID=A0A0L0RYA5_ALLM3|nr:hypothetical protein AMAG_01000 [Allomyces macrogynus ATCC 38327]|eukprot:KNE55064.1 hypothetical protein AMAG_01000 [Allomyces macrogynus ATCC 38327]
MMMTARTILRPAWTTTTLPRATLTRTMALSATRSAPISTPMMMRHVARRGTATATLDARNDDGSVLPPAPVTPRADAPISLDLSAVPTTPKLLGLAGLIPFAGATVGAWTCVGADDIIAFQLVEATYGASILAFMGAVHWGTAMAHEGVTNTNTLSKRYALSVLPSLIGWATLSMPADIALATQLAAFNALLYADVRAWRHGSVPRWYPNLRIWLTGIVSACLGATWLARFREKRARAAEVAAAAAAAVARELEVEVVDK